MKNFFVIVFLAAAIPAAAQITTEELDPYFDLVDSTVHRLDHRATMTVKIVHYEEHSERPHVREKITFRYINDSVLEQRFYDRSLDKRQYFLLRNGVTFEYDYRHSRIIDYGMPSEKDSAGYHVSVNYYPGKKDTAVYYQRTKTDSARHYSFTFSTSSRAPDREYEYENYNDTLLVSRQYKTSGGARRLVTEQRHRHIVHHRGSIEDIYTSTYYDLPGSDEPVTQITSSITHVQYDSKDRPVYVIKLNYSNGAQEKENTLQIIYEE